MVLENVPNCAMFLTSVNGNYSYRIFEVEIGTKLVKKIQNCFSKANLVKISIWEN